MHLILSFSFTNIVMEHTTSKLLIMDNTEEFHSAIMSINVLWKNYNLSMMNGKLMMCVLHVANLTTIQQKCYKLYSYLSL